MRFGLGKEIRVRMLKQTIQRGRRRVETGGVASLGYVEDSVELRTKLGACFSILTGGDILPCDIAAYFE